MKKSLSLLALLLSTAAFAQMSPEIPAEQRLGTITVEEVFPMQMKSFGEETTGTGSGDEPKQPRKDPFDTAGKVISTAKDMVALGEQIYELVKKGKPTNTTEYAPISVVPKDPASKEYVDPFELEGFSMPEERNFVARITNGVGKEVVRFEYKVMYSYGGSFNGRGKFLTGVMVVPSSIKTSWGWDFSASMRLLNIMNHGSKDAPVAGAIIGIKYQMNSWSAAFERNDTIHVTGQGQLKNYSIR